MNIINDDFTALFYIYNAYICMDAFEEITLPVSD